MHRLWIPLAALAFAIPVWAQAPADALRPYPAAVSLRGKDDRQQLLIAASVGSKSIDVTSETTFVSTNPAVATVTSDGIATPVGDGETTILAKARGKETSIKVVVRDGKNHLPVTFEKDVQPILARAGCNSGPCHGKTRGQNGFQLSLLGFDDDFDYAALTAENRGRRIFPASPNASLLLLKGAGEVAHGGGRKIQVGDPHYVTLRRWIASGAPRTPATEPKLLRISVEPSERILDAKAAQQLAVTAIRGWLHRRAHLAMYQSNESVVAADPDAKGHVKAGPLPGEAAIMARYMENSPSATC
ncbi:MAG: Ig-like domain-containing protein [Gemmataceae bacterium]